MLKLGNGDGVKNSPGYFCCGLFLWLVSTACQTSTVLGWSLNGLVMDLGACTYDTYICGTENDPNGCHLVVFSVEVAFAHHYVAPHHPHPSPYRGACGIG